MTTSTTICCVMVYARLRSRTSNYICGVVRGEILLGLGFSWRAYLKRFSLAHYSHCKCCTLILLFINLDPWIHRYVALTKVIEILLFMYPHILD